MSLRTIPSSLDPAIVAKIDARLAALARDERVTLVLAIESGSRAWGFPSPDSDYDCRFIYVRRPDDYLALFPKRDVIETPLDAVFDVNGWDVVKALKLLLKGNAVVIEWLTSPIVYQGDPWFRDEMRALAVRVADRALVARHYLHLGERQRHAYFVDGETIRLKKLFYALRPAAALRWLRLHPGEAYAPMHFPTLLDECAPPDAVRELAAELMARKAVTHELGEGALPQTIAQFIDMEFAAARETFESGSALASADARTDAQAFFHQVLARFS